MLSSLGWAVGGRAEGRVRGGSAQGRHDSDEWSSRGGCVEERRDEEEEEEEERGWYITSKLVQLEDDQIASRVINRSAVLPPSESQFPRV